MGGQKHQGLFPVRNLDFDQHIVKFAAVFVPEIMVGHTGFEPIKFLFLIN